MFLWILFWLNIVMIWFITHGSAVADGCRPMWRWPRPAGAPEWDTDGNGKFRLFCTWVATIMDITLIYFVIRWIIYR